MNAYKDMRVHVSKTCTCVCILCVNTQLEVQVEGQGIWRQPHTSDGTKD